MRFADRTVVVTGASMGIGEAIAAAFAAEGAHVVLAARSNSLLANVAAKLTGSRGQILAVTADVTSEADVCRLAAESLTLTGRVDVLVNNAGVGMNGAVESLNLDDWRQCLEVNLLGSVRVAQAFLPAMKASGGGTIVQISSVLGKVSVPYSAGYNASKFALNAVSDALRIELAPDGIGVVSVYPGSTESNFRENKLGPSNLPKVRPQKRIPADRVGRRVVEAVWRKERDVYVTWKDALLCWVGSRFPAASDRLLDFLHRRQARQMGAPDSR